MSALGHELPLGGRLTPSAVPARHQPIFPRSACTRSPLRVTQLAARCRSRSGANSLRRCRIRRSENRSIAQGYGEFAHRRSRKGWWSASGPRTSGVTRWRPTGVPECSGQPIFNYAASRSVPLAACARPLVLDRGLKPATTCCSVLLHARAKEALPATSGALAVFRTRGQQTAALLSVSCRRGYDCKCERNDQFHFKPSLTETVSTSMPFERAVGSSKK